MSLSVTVLNSWSQKRWWIMVALVMGLQVGFILWLGSRAPILARPPAAAPRLRLTGAGAGELVALTDPTLFALPNSHGFSGQAWLSQPPVPFQPFTWSEPPRWMPLDTHQLGSQFQQYMQTNPLISWHLPFRAAPELTLPDGPPPPPLSGASSLSFSGGLDGRRLMLPTTADLPAWPSSTLLAPTVVQLLVDAEGHPVSATLLKPGSGLADADHYALDKARTMLFEAIPRPSAETSPSPLSGLVWGQAVFRWHTTPQTPSQVGEDIAP